MYVVVVTLLVRYRLSVVSKSCEFCEWKIGRKTKNRRSFSTQNYSDACGRSLLKTACSICWFVGTSLK